MNNFARYIAYRIMLMIPTLLGIMTISFIIVQFVPGGPVDRMIARLTTGEVAATAAVGGSEVGGGDTAGMGGLDPEMIAELEALFGFDRPVHERYFKMIWDYARFDFGNSYYKDQSVLSLIGEKLPVSLSLGFWTLLLTYLISIPLGVAKALRSGSAFDIWTSIVVIVGYAIPAFLFAILLVLLFAGGTFLAIFPSRGLVSEHWDTLGPIARIGDYLWHITLPVISMTVGAFASLTMLSKNSVLDEINKQYVITARAKGLTENGVLYGHVFRNAMLVVIAGFPTAFVTVLFSSALLIEVIFSLDGLGLLGFESAINRDYPVMLGSLFIFSLLGLTMNLLGDITYTLVDPRIDFSRRSL